MKMTIYGILLIAYILYICLTKKNSKKRFIEFFILSVFLYLNVTIGYVFKIGEQTIAGYFVAMICTAISAIPCIRKMSQKRFIIMTIFILNIFLSLMLIPFLNYQVIGTRWDAYLFGRNEMAVCAIGWTHIKELVKALAFVLVIEAVHKELEDSDWVYLVSKVTKWSKIVLCYCVMEFVAVYFFKIYNLYDILLRPIFGLKKYTYTSAISRGNGYQLQGLFTEPSSYVTGLFLIMLMLVTQLQEHKKEKCGILKKKNYTYLWIAVCLFLMIMSMSFSSILYIALFVVLLLIHVSQTERKHRTIIFASSFIIAIIGICAFFVLLNSESYYGMRLSGVLQILKTALFNSDMSNLYFHLRGTHADGSSISRIGSAIGILKIEFIQNPLFGLGVGTGDSYAEFSNMLTDLGIIGTVCWMKMVVFKQKKKNAGVNFALTAIAVSAFLSSPFFYLGADAIILAYIVEALCGNQKAKMISKNVLNQKIGIIND